ncbi:nuclear transport factor 2 family protein [Rhodospirillaceae bacterium SYSU D60014]|uniref:nuclear transport factor 2 family protein n=1 Tax=Virgifigura deserti TaxID=2268457 RepID=UPI000E67629C
MSPLSRSVAEVSEDHLRLRLSQDLETDLQRNYAPDVILLTVYSVLHGHDGLRRSSGRLQLQLPGARFEFSAKQVDGEFAFLVWRADSKRYRVECGADSFLIRDGLIRMQTIHYHLLPKS